MLALIYWQPKVHFRYPFGFVNFMFVSNLLVSFFPHKNKIPEK